MLPELLTVPEKQICSPGEGGTVFWQRLVTVSLGSVTLGQMMAAQFVMVRPLQ
jgi:hypothetical protein